MQHSRIDALIGALAQVSHDDIDAELEKHHRIERSNFLSKGFSPKDADFLARAIVAHAAEKFRKIGMAGFKTKRDVVELSRFLN